MEADWSVEIGEGLPSIHVPWTGFCDLRGLDASAIKQKISEAAGAPALAAALASLNAAASPVYTSKSDVWLLDPAEIDPFEFDSELGEAVCGRACYIDILPRDPAVFASFLLAETWARAFARSLATVPKRNARAEVVVRAATSEAGWGYALTLYAFGCGSDEPEAAAAWEHALAASGAATIATIPSIERVAGE